MDETPTLIQFMAQNREKLLEQILEHIGLTLASLVLAIAIAIPVGIWISRTQKIAPGILGFAGILQTIPSIALLGFLIPLLGIGVKPAIFALFLYALLPILRNTYTGIREVEAAVVEAATGMGMKRNQILRKVEIPLALPIIFAGIRTATVINVGVATLAAYIGAGGLGEFIFGGIALNNSQMILAGAIPAAVLAIVFDQLLALVQRNPRFFQTHLNMALPLLVVLGGFFFMASGWYAPGLKAGFDPEFAGRRDGLPGLVEKYGLSFNTVMLNSTLMYEAIKEKEVDVIGGYSTDGRIKAFQLRMLDDNRHAFPPYYCAPLVHQGIRRDHPEVIDALELLAGKINDSTMRELNYQVEFLKQAPEEVARNFLESQNLWKPDRAEGGETLIIGSKIFTEQYLLVELFSQIINGHTDLDVDARPGLGGTKICFDALKNQEIDLYPEYTGTGFQVILSPSDSTVRRLIEDADGVYTYVQQAFEEQFGVYWLQPLGFNNTYALMVREHMAKEKNWVQVSDLAERP